jgi:hypothetical protein
VIALKSTARVICTVVVEAATVVTLALPGRRSDLAVPVHHLGPWLRTGDSATVLVALLRWVALLTAGWLLVTTLLYLAAAASRVPAAVRAVRWSTLPAARRAIDAALAVSVVTSVVLAPTAAGAVRSGSDAISVSVVRDGRNTGNAAGAIAQLPPDTTAPPRNVPSPRVAQLPAVPVPTATVKLEPQPVEVVVHAGDSLWELAASHLAVTSARARADVSDAEVAQYWGRVCGANETRLTSGDPNLVFPGERVVLPPIS